MSSVLQFQESIQQAVVLSLTQSKPLVILVLDDSETSDKWETKIFTSSSDNNTENNDNDSESDNTTGNELSEISLNFLINQSVNLKIRKNTQDFEFFKQSFSTVDYHNLPICIINFGSSIIETLTHDLSINDINDKLENVNQKFLLVRSSMIQGASTGVSGESTDRSEQATGIQTAVETPSQTPTPTPTPTLTPTPTPTTTSASTPSASASTPAASTSTSTPSLTPTPKNEQDEKKKPKKKYGSLKEEAAEYAAQKYRENLMKQQQVAKEERQRILRLLKADKEERIHLRNEELKKRKREAAEKKRLEQAGSYDYEEGEDARNKNGEKEEEEVDDKEREQDEEMADTTSSSVHENINKLNIKETEFNLQIKLFDGLNIRSKFNREDNLRTVREFICNKQTAYREQEFFFYKPIDRMTYSEQDEYKSLFELRLNRATLILKPLELNENNSNNGDSINSGDYQRDYGNGSAISWLRNKVGSTISGFWGGAASGGLKRESKGSASGSASGSSSTATDSSDKSKLTNDASSDLKDKDGDSSMIQSSSRYRDNEDGEDNDQVTAFRPYHDNESEYDEGGEEEEGEAEEEVSIYHSPEVRSFLSRTASPEIMMGSVGNLSNSNLGSTNISNSNNNNNNNSNIPKLNLNSSSSNFSLNTSGGVANTGNTIDNTGGNSSPLIRPSIVSQSRVGVVSASNSTPSSPYASSSRIRTLNDQVNFSLNDSKLDNSNEEDKNKINLKKKKKREVYNGNNVNLEDKKDDK